MVGIYKALRLFFGLGVLLFVAAGCAQKYVYKENVKTLEKLSFYPSDALYYLAAGDVKTHYPKTGFYSLWNNYDALSARIALIDKAKTSLDLQYFIFAKDESSIAVAKKVLDAANRGVKVRILVDDLLEKGNDKIIASLAIHPNIEIKLFNPTTFRALLGWLEIAFNVNTLGRRMHNKLLIADNSAVILGGRNIENLYYAIDNERIFIDSDILAIGPLAAEASNSFEEYWNSDLAVYIEELAKREKLYNFAKMQRELNKAVEKYATSKYIAELSKRECAKLLRQNNLPLIYGDAKLYYDKAEKVSINQNEIQTHLSWQIEPLVKGAQKSIIIINPYFMPNERMMSYMKQLIKRGVDIAVLTNSLSTNDAIGVYAYYSYYHKELLRAGVKLYELSPYAFEEIYKTHSYRNGKIPRSSLHAKVMIIDDDTLIIGSANLDPRSMKLNTEVVAVIYSKELVRNEKKVFSELIDEKNAYTLSLHTREGDECSETEKLFYFECVDVVWEGRRNNKTIRYYNNDAGASFSRRIISNISRWMPIEGYL